MQDIQGGCGVSYYTLMLYTMDEKMMDFYNKSGRYGMVHMNSLTLYFLLFLMFAGWLGIVFYHTILPYIVKDSTKSLMEGDVSFPKYERPFWFIVCSMIIVFAVFVMILTSLVYEDKKKIYAAASSFSFGEIWKDIGYSFSFVFSRLNIFFSEVFLMIIYLGFIYLNFQFYDDIRKKTKIRSFDYSLIVLIASTGLQIFIFMYSYIVQRDTSKTSYLLDDVPLLRNMLLPMRLLQLQQSPDSLQPIYDNMKYINTILIIIGMSSLLFMYIILKFYTTDG